MFLGDVLIAHGLVGKEDVDAALLRQTRHGGRLGDNLVALGRLTQAQLDAALHAVPSAPRSLEETGIDLQSLLDLQAKAMYTGACDTASKLYDVLRLPVRLTQQLLREAEQRQLVESAGLATGGGAGEIRYTLTAKGRQWADNAFEQNSYVGPAPVPLEDYVRRIERQAIARERITPAEVRKALDGLIMADRLIAQIGPAINSGHSMLLYGPPGNGKSSVAERIGRIFAGIIYVPHCFEVAGQIVKVLDPSIHRAVTIEEEKASRGPSILREEYDRRWVPCHRPFIITGGELTLEMLDLSFNPLAKFYEAPLHVKALNGIFLIDDFGRQIVSPEALLNRWIVPLASRIDYLKLHTGKSFALPFDELVIFSTNLAPSQLMDPAFLRRIPYKIEVGAPCKQTYRDIFRLVGAKRGIATPEEVVDAIITELTERNDFPLAAYQPGFIVDQVQSACKYIGREPALTPDLVEMAIANLYTKDSPGYGMVRSAR